MLAPALRIGVPTLARVASPHKNRKGSPMNLLFHPAVVHLPVGLALILPLVAIWVYRKHPQAWSLVVILLGLQVAGTHLGLYTGERIEEAYEQVRGEQTGPAIHEHEELAEGLLVLAWAGFVLAAGGLLLPLRFRRAVQVGTLLLTLGIAAQALRTGHAGGVLVYGPDQQVPGAPAGTAARLDGEDADSDS